MENSIERKILELFLFKNELRFNEIEKEIKIRSNKLAYHIKNLIKKGILIKTNENYLLSETAENIIPYLSNKKSPLPILLIHIGDSKKCFLYQRNKRPFKNKLSLPGGRLLVNESISSGVKRILKEKFNINAALKKINSLSLEHVKKKNSYYSFLLIFVSAKAKDEINLINIQKNKSKIITSDYYLLKNDLNKEIKINTLYSRP